MNCDYYIKWVNKTGIFREETSIIYMVFCNLFSDLTEKYAAVLTRALLKVLHQSYGWLALVG